MKEKILKFLFFLLILGLTSAGYTNALFHSQTTILNNTFSTTCWVPPTIPQLIYPTNGYLANLGSDWLANPYMDWSNSSTTCPGGIIRYEYESYDDAGLASLAYRSGLLPESMIPAPGTPDGTYYWRVRTFDGSNWSDWSEVWLLTVDRSVPPPSPGSDNSPSGTPATSPPYSSAIVINEILPDPVGLDDAAKLNGEWVELYNRSDSDVDVGGWFLYDSVDANEVEVLASRTNSGLTAVPAHGFLVVYRDGDPDFNLNQGPEGDEVRLFTNRISLGGILIDSHTYSGPVAEGKSIARYPDGSDTWYDPIPTPGGPNKLESEIEEAQGEAQLEEPALNQDGTGSAQESTEVAPEDEVVTGEIEEVIDGETGEELVEEVVEEKEVVSEDEVVDEAVGEEEITEPSGEVDEATVEQLEGDQAEEDKEQQEVVKPQDVKPEEERAVEEEDSSEDDGGPDQSPVDEPPGEPQPEEQPGEEIPTETPSETDEQT